MKYAILAVGFLIAVTPTMVAGVWNGQSFLGLMIVMGAAGWIWRTEYMDKVDNDV
jgi:hypothetical protein